MSLSSSMSSSSSSSTTTSLAGERVLVTGGAGYIGSHTVHELLAAGVPSVTVVDNLSNSDLANLQGIKRLWPTTPVAFVNADLRHADLDVLMSWVQPTVVLHFAALKSVSESIAHPLLYYENNVAATVRLLEAMERHGCRRFVFSSSATVYGDQPVLPVREDTVLRPVTNPYGRTKRMVEEILQDLVSPSPPAPPTATTLSKEEDSGNHNGGVWEVCILRYFNPVGAHPSGCLQEQPRGTPSNLMPYVAQVGDGVRPFLHVYGDDYPTPDGTGVRDYIHVVDLARGHVAALRHLHLCRGQARVYNLGTGRGYSVYEMADAYARVNGVAIPRRVVPRRPGDVAVSYADPSRASHEWGWRAIATLDDMVRRPPPPPPPSI